MKRINKFFSIFALSLFFILVSFLKSTVALAVSSNIAFSTSSDPKGPKIISSTIDDRFTLSESITFTFDKDITVDNFSENDIWRKIWIKIYTQYSVEYLPITYSVNCNNLTITSNKSFEENKYYDIYIPKEIIKDINGNSMQQHYFSSFKYVKNFQIIYANFNNSILPIDYKLRITFSKPVDLNALNSNNIIVKYAEGNQENVKVKFELDPKFPNKVVITPEKYFDYNKEYQVVITSNLKSQSGEYIDKSSTFRLFTYPESTSISIEPKNIEVGLGKYAEAYLYAVFKDGSKQMVPYSEAVPGNPELIEIEDNNIKGIKPGNTTIAYKFQGKSTTLSVTVIGADKEIVGISISSSSVLSLEVGKNLNLTAKVNYSDNSSKDITTLTNWTSSDYDIVDVQNGKIIAKRPGRAEIMARYNGHGASTDIIVSKSIKSLSVRDNTIVLPKGGDKEINLIALNTDNSSEVIQDDYTAVSTKPDIAKVENGRICAFSEGTAVITFTYSGKSTTVKVNVKPKLKSLSVTPISTSVEIGKNTNIKAITTYENNKTEDVTKYVDWSLADTEGDYITFSQGSIKPIKYTVEPIEVRARFGLDDTTAAANLNVVPKIKTFVANTSNSILLTKGQYFFVDLGIEYSDDSYIPYDVWSSVSVTSSNKNVVKASLYGLIAENIGTSKITYSFGSKTIIISVTVKPEIDYITVNTAGPILEQNSSNNIKVRAYYKDGTNEDVSKLATYISEYPQVVSVNQGKIVSSNVSYISDVTISFGDCEPITLPVCVLQKDVKVTSLTSDRTSYSLRTGEMVAPTLTATLMNNDKFNVTPVCIWESSNEKVAAVNPYTGEIIAGIQGTATITARFASKSIKLSVTVAPVIERIKLSYDNYGLNKNQSTNLKVYAKYYGEDKLYDITSKIKRENWISDDENIVSFAGGKVSAINIGETTVRVLYVDGDNYYESSCNIKVVPKVISINANATKIDLVKGDTSSLFITSNFIDGSTEEITLFCIYKSSNTKVVSVDSSGNLIAKGTGVAKIVVNFCGAQTTITVNVK